MAFTDSKGKTTHRFSSFINQNPRLPTAGGMEAVNIATNKVFETLKIKTFTYFLIKVFYNLAAFESNCL